MTWYAVHVVMMVRLKNEAQSTYPVWENIYLIQAENPIGAQEKGDAIGKEHEGDSSGTFNWDEQPAEWVYKGVRKIVEIANSRSVNNDVGDGAEITYQVMEFGCEKALQEYVDGNPVSVKIKE